MLLAGHTVISKGIMLPFSAYFNLWAQQQAQNMYPMPLGQIDLDLIDQLKGHKIGVCEPVYDLTGCMRSGLISTAGLQQNGQELCTRAHPHQQIIKLKITASV